MLTDPFILYFCRYLPSFGQGGEMVDYTLYDTKIKLYKKIMVEHENLIITALKFYG